MKKNNIFDISFVTLGLLIQVFAYCWIPLFQGGEFPHWLSLVSGLCGILSVFYCSQGKMIFYFFGMLQIATYQVLCIWENLYGQMFMNLFFFACQCYGIYHWRKQLREADKGNSESVPAIALSPRQLTALTIALLAVSAAVGFVLSRYTNDTQPYLDAFTTVPALVAEVLMILAIRDQWYVWFGVDLIYCILWFRAGDYCMLMQYAFWTVNCIYGFAHWSKSLKHE